jgi:hypothetical protein
MIAALFACGGPPGSPPHSPVSGPDSGAHTTPTDHTGQPNHSDVTPAAPGAPWVVLRGRRGQDLGKSVMSVGDTDADGLEELAVGYKWGSLFIAPHLLTPSSDDPDSAVVATHETTVQEHALSPAGDTNRDGFDDVWIGDRLFLGPLKGDYLWYDESFALVDSAATAVEGGFDADGDGWMDMAVSDVRGRTDVHFGPFDDGLRSGHYDPGFDPTRVTQIAGLAQYGTGILVNLGAVNEPGQIALTAGWGCVTGGCDDTRAYDVRGPRGRILYERDAFAVFETLFDFSLQPMGDATGDGLDDVLVHSNVRASAPVQGRYPDNSWSGEPDVPEYHAYHVTSMNLTTPVGDVTGDGLTDLLFTWPKFEGDVFLGTWYTVVSGTAPGPGPTWRPEELGLTLELPPDVMPTGYAHLNLDGDAYDEIVISSSTTAPGGVVYIFRGADLVDGYRALFPTP